MVQRAEDAPGAGGAGHGSHAARGHAAVSDDDVRSAEEWCSPNGSTEVHVSAGRGWWDRVRRTRLCAVFTGPSRHPRSQDTPGDLQQRPEHRAQGHDETGRDDARDDQPDQEEEQDAGRAPPGAVRTAPGGQLTGPLTPPAQGCTPRRRAERARWRLLRIRRSRLTSIGSCASAAGESMSALSSW